MGRPSVVLASAALLVLSGCTVMGRNRTIDAPPAPPATVHDHWSGCAAVGAFDGYAEQPPTGGSIPAGFTAASLIWCANSDRIDPSAPRRGLERRSTRIRPMLDYLALPSRIEAPGSDGVCSADLQIFPWLVLLDSRQRWIMPKLPTDECDKTLPTLGGGPAPWTTLRYTDRVVCTYRETTGTTHCR